MSKFTFDKKEPKLLKLEIEGKIFRLNPYSLAVTKAAERFTQCQGPIINALKKKPNEKELDRLVLRSCELVRETVNRMLGKNAYEKIFSGRTVDFQEHQLLMTFIFEEITAFCQVNPKPRREPFA